jgi:class 3 adenylate cyclase
VAVYSDITELKQREQDLTEKSAALAALSAKLAKYLAPQVYQLQKVKIASKRKKLTVCFSDIVGFTDITDKMESEDLTQLLNHYLTEMANIALQHGATIDKYVGDGIVMFFGDPETRGVEEDTRACVRMALAMQKRVRELAELWQDMGIETPLRCRIGIHGRARTLLALMDAAILDPRSGTVSTSAPGMGSSGGNDPAALVRLPMIESTFRQRKSFGFHPASDSFESSTMLMIDRRPSATSTSARHSSAIFSQRSFSAAFTLSAIWAAKLTCSR